MFPVDNPDITDLAIFIEDLWYIDDEQQ